MAKSGDRSGVALNVDSSLPRQVIALLALLDSMDAWLSNDEDLCTEDIIGWRDTLAGILGVEAGTWFERSARVAVNK